MVPLNIGWTGISLVKNSSEEVTKTWSKYNDGNSTTCTELEHTVPHIAFYDVTFNITDEPRVESIYVKGANLQCGVNIFASVIIGDISCVKMVECNVTYSSDVKCIFQCPRIQNGSALPSVINIRALLGNRFMSRNITICDIGYQL